MANNLKIRQDIFFSNIESVSSFLNITNMYEEDINVYDGRFCFDGKSTLAMLNLVGKELKLEIITDDISLKNAFYEEVINNVKKG